MARFVFQLDGVLKHRKSIERDKQRELALVQAQMHGLENELRQLDESVRNTTQDVRQNHLVGRLDMNFLAAHRRYMVAMQRQAMALVQKMALVQRQLEEAQKTLAEAAKQRKIIEKLREKQHQRWKDDQSRRELAEADEVSTQLSYRQQVAEPEAAA